MLRTILKWFLIANGAALGLLLLVLYVEAWIHQPLFMGIGTYFFLLLVCIVVYD